MAGSLWPKELSPRREKGCAAGRRGLQKTLILLVFMWRSVYGNKRYKPVTKSPAKTRNPAKISGYSGRRL
jgi:hypothetical protein